MLTLTPSYRWKFAVLLIVFASSLFACNMLSAAEPAEKTWPQFLGPNRNGISTETNLLNTYGPNGPKVVWRVPGGIGMSGFAVDTKQAITLLERNEKQTVVAFNITNGKELWSLPVAEGYGNGQGPGPRATPTLAGGSVFVYTGEGILVAIDANTGKKQWQHDVVSELNGKVAEYGMASSPLVTDGLVIITAGAPGATVVAYQADSGKLAWKSGEDASGYSSPTILTVGGMRQLVVLTGSAVSGLKPTTGELLWKYDFKTNFECNIATPIAINDQVFISAGENHGSALLALKKDGTNFQVSEVWASFGATSVFRNEWQTSILLDGYLYGMDNVGGAGPITHLACLNAKTGQRAWQQAKFGKGNFVYADGKLYIITMRGELVIVRAKPEKFEELARAKVLGTTRQAPALLNGKLYLRDDNEIVCVDISAAK